MWNEGGTSRRFCVGLSYVSIRMDVLALGKEGGRWGKAYYLLLLITIAFLNYTILRRERDRRG